MNWSDEHYVKLYTRDSLTWRSWHWEARTVFLHLVRKVDNSGFIETGRMSIVDALVLQLELPKHVVEPGMTALIGSGTCEAVDGAVLLVKFNEAQEARKTDAQKKRDERSRNIAKRRERMSPAVTGSHPVSPAVTQTAPPSPAQPVPSPTPTSSPVTAAAEKPKAPTLPEKPPPPLRPVPADKFADAESFWAWAQSKRVEVGLLNERFPSQPRALSAWWSEVGMALNGNYELLEEAWYRFGADPHWKTRAPPAPFAGFMSQWTKFIPQHEVAHVQT